ncbi:MAG: conserved exported protein of unknown function [Candidatus Thorarchaeota archaeon]|nr:MAG: conserved exported protein of unknown function [Candidatus Thorarchaeota archaeon]
MYFKRLIAPLLIVSLMLMPLFLVPVAAAYSPGDEEAIFGHTFSEEYWTNDSIIVSDDDTGIEASFTASYVGVDDFQAFLIAFNNVTIDENTQLMLPYQLFGMHYQTPENKEVFIGAIFAFLLVHNETYGDNDLPDVGNEDAWYIVPVTRNLPWDDVTPTVEAIPVTKMADNHYRFGMRYTDLVARVVSANSESGFVASLGLPLMTALFSEFVIEYDIIINPDGTVEAETLYTIGQVERIKALWWELDPFEIISDTMEISAVHYLSVFTSEYNVTSTSTGNTIEPPTSTNPLDENLTITVGNNSERAFDIGMGREYQLINETSDPWDVISASETALNSLLGARKSDFILIAWQAPFSAWLFAHMAYGLSERVRNTYNSVGALVNNAGTAFHNSQWWYAVTFPEWNGYRVQQDPVYTAYTNLSEQVLGGRNLLLIAAVGIIALLAVAVVLRRR